MNNNDPEFIEHSAIEVKRPSRFPCLIKKIAMACFVTGVISLLILTYYSYAVLTSQMTQIEKQLSALPEAVAALAPKPQPITTDQGVTAAEHNATSLVNEKEEKTAIDSRQHELLTMIVAVSELREAARRGIPYYKELVILEESDDPVIAEKITLIEPYAQSGIKNIATLRESFKEVSRAIKGAGESAQKDSNLSSLTKQFSSLIKIRKINESTTGTSTEAVVMRTEKALTDADIPKAIAELDQLQDEEIKKLSAAWISDAESSLEAIEESEALYQHVIKMPFKGQTP